MSNTAVKALMRRWADHDLCYVDATDREGAEDDAMSGPELTDALIERGFRIAGYLEQQRPDGGRSVTATLVDPDRLCFARPEWLFGLPHLSIKTMLEDGVIVDTRNAVRRSIHEWLPILSPYHHQPSAGYFTEVMGRASPEQLWERHQERLSQIVSVRHTRIRPHDMSLCVAAMNRSWAVGARRARVGSRVCALIWVVAAGMGCSSTLSASVQLGLGLLALPLGPLGGSVMALAARFRPKPLPEVMGPFPEVHRSGQVLH